MDVQHDVQSVAQAPAKGYMSDLKAFLRPGIGRSLLEFERLFPKTDRSKVAQTAHKPARVLFVALGLVARKKNILEFPTEPSTCPIVLV